jgi:hypothetical protein
MTSARPLAQQDLLPSDEEDGDYVPDAQESQSEDEDERVVQVETKEPSTQAALFLTPISDVLC